jgi:hypothetical protein
MTKNDESQRTDQQNEAGDSRPRKPYIRPCVKRLGTVSEVVRFPGGSINLEGLSGKPHQQ